MTRGRLAAVAAALLLPAACSTYNPLVAVGIMSEPAYKPTPLGAINVRVVPKVICTTPVGKSNGYRFRPDSEGGRVYTASGDGFVTVLEEESGKVVSRVETKKPLSGGVEAGENRIIVGTIKGEVVALDLAGKAAWTANVGGEVIAPASISRKVAVVRTADGRIFGFNADDGKRLWVFQRPTPTLLLRSEAGVFTQGGDVVAGYSNGKLVALDIQDGKLTWEVTVAQPRGTTELERIADVAGLPVVDGPVICAGAFQGKVGCFEIQSRNMVWSRDISSSRSLARDARYVYVVDDTGGVHALDKNTGASAWKNDRLIHRRVTEPVAIQGYVIVGDGFGYLHVISPEDGAIIGRLATDGTAIHSIVPAAGGVLLQTTGGALGLVRF